jgi:TolA-binding protein
MFRYVALFALVLLVFNFGCKSTFEKRINKDITGINEQLYDLEKKQIKQDNRVKSLESGVKKIETDKKEQEGKDLEPDANQVYKDGYKDYLEQKYEEAIKLFAQLTDRFKEDSLVDNALYWQAEAYLKLNKTDQALNYYQLLYRYFPFSRKADYALYKIGLIYSDMKDYPRALLAFNRLVNEYAGSDLYKTAALKIKQLKSKNRRR